MPSTCTNTGFSRQSPRGTRRSGVPRPVGTVALIGYLPCCEVVEPAACSSGAQLRGARGDDPGDRARGNGRAGDRVESARAGLALAVLAPPRSACDDGERRPRSADRQASKLATKPGSMIDLVAEARASRGSRARACRSPGLRRGRIAVEQADHVLVAHAAAPRSRQPTSVRRRVVARVDERGALPLPSAGAKRSPGVAARRWHSSPPRAARGRSPAAAPRRGCARSTGAVSWKAITISSAADAGRCRPARGTSARRGCGGGVATAARWCSSPVRASRCRRRAAGSAGRGAATTALPSRIAYITPSGMPPQTRITTTSAPISAP